MGIFDFLKSKEQRKLEAIQADIEMLKQMKEKVFPNGAQQVTIEINAVIEILNFKYNREQLEAPYLVACRTFYLDKDNRPSQVVKNIQKASKNLISKDEAYIIYLFISAKDLPPTEDVNQPVQKPQDAEKHRAIADKLYTIAKNAVREIESFQRLTKKGEFEVILFSSACILEEHMNRHPDVYQTIQSIYWERILFEAQDWGLQFENDIETFLNERLWFNLSQRNVIERRQADNLSTSKMLYYCFYDNPLCKTPIESSVVPNLLKFTQTIWHMVDELKAKTKEI